MRPGFPVREGGTIEPVAASRRALGVTPAELREAERGFRLMLAKKFSAVWIAENAKDILSQANVEYAEWLEQNPPARNPVGWLLTCAYRRAVNLLDTQSRKPRPASLDSVFHLADESTPTPEQQALDRDRQRRLRKALSHLPEKECKLLALVYFEGMSIREAGRKVGWQKSVADRHHDAAMEKMLALVGDRSLLSPAPLGLAAWVLIEGERHRLWVAPLHAIAESGRECVAIAAEAATTGAHRVGELWRRVSPLAEPSNAAAAGGAGRAAGYCAAAAGAVVCGLAATGVIGPGVSVVNAERQESAKPRTVAEPANQVSTTAPVVTETLRRAPRQSGSAEQAAEPEANGDQAKPRKRSPRPQLAPQATGADTVDEFGVDRGGGEDPESAPAPESSGGESAAPASKPDPSPPPKSSDSAPSAEFGM